ncbi:transporter substrate-binding domain-containing protein [Anoxynatronum buryatiense]|uniref:histidine kinase n=1 Tax=Anoxynatronum buryatiense TaxID=489973 RepID=A0AA45WWN7_9CLOT|nr:transporter substrate-binding domain-containing protein [Anoxynatronum buryatiense]SMP60009.1 amino acid-binding domain sensor histidine kinase [Anoxynatronum buryatiense]
MRRTEEKKQTSLSHIAAALKKRCNSPRFTRCLLALVIPMLVVPLVMVQSVPVEAALDNPYLQRQHLVLRVAFDPRLAPLQYETPEGYQGFSIDLLEIMGSRNDFRVQWMPMTMTQAQKSLQEGTVDVIMGIDYQARLAPEMEFTEPFFSSTVGLMVPAGATEIESIADLSEKLVAIQRHSLEHDFLQNVWRINFNTTENLVDGLALMEMNRAEALVGDRLVLQHALSELQLEDAYQFVSSYVIPLEYAMAVKKENFGLLNLLNRGLQQAKGQGIHHELQEKWFGSNLLQARLEQTLKALGFILALIFGVFLISLWWNRMLQKEVQRKTGELKAANRDLEYQILETRNMSGLMEQIMRNSPRGLVTVDRKGLVTALNPRAQELTGEAESLKDKHYTASPLLETLLETRLKHVLEEGVQYVGGELRWQPEEKGSRVDIRYTLYPARDVEKQITGMILTLEDITEERKQREQGFEREKSRALHQVVAGIAHEIRNPLTSIKTFVELIPAKILNPQFQENIVRHVPREVERVSQLIESLIDYARPRPPNREVFDAAELLRSCTALFEPVFNSKGFQLKSRLEPDCVIQADRDQIKQVLVNFLLNGLEAMEMRVNGEEMTMPPSMTTSCRLDGAHVWIDLKDEGVGMSPEELKNILEPFYSTKKDGTGLGLPLSKRYLEDNGAVLSFESEKGQGTIVHLQFERMTDRG